MPRSLHWAWNWGLGYEPVQALRQREANSLCQLRGTQLVVALALYELEKGQPAATLDALVPGYLPSVPQDPYSGQPFHYRISKGEKIERQLPAQGVGVGSLGGPESLGPGEENAGVVNVPAGQGVVWSVGPEQQDTGGTHDGSRMFTSDRPWLSGVNWVFLVPQWAGKEQSK